MSSSPSSEIAGDWKQTIQVYWQQGDYAQAENLYEQAIAAEPEVKSHYWHLGLALLLQGQEAEAQTTWLFAMAEGEPKEMEQWSIELSQVLEAESDRQEQSGNFQLAWLVRRHLREIQPQNLNNLLRLVCLSAHLQQLTGSELVEIEIIPLLKNTQHPVDQTLLLHTLEVVLKSVAPDGIVVDFTAACIPYTTAKAELMQVILSAAIEIAYSLRYPLLSAHLVEQYCAIDPNNLEILWHLAIFYLTARKYEQGVEVARSRFALADAAVERVLSNKLIVRGVVGSGGYWHDSLAALELHRKLLSDLVSQQLVEIPSAYTVRLFNSPYYMPYFYDDLRQNRTLQNQIMRFCQANIHSYAGDRIARYQSRATRSTSSKRLKVGYLSHCMGQHSVGWLARWLFKHHDRERVELHGYFVTNRVGDTLHGWYQSQMEHVCRMGIDCADNALDLADRICEDDLNVLIDLDSITLDVTCEILTLKPAPVQATWLGWDAAGIPTVDYFIADPYVLPEWAQEYYPETIWRLPQTYLAVDGFEVEVPTLRRDDLEIPTDAIIYLSSQKGCKRHRDAAKLQMQIIKQVPNSYFLIKGFADQNSIQNFFMQLAEEEGVNPDRLRFLPDAPSEAVHRANLGIADVVLDTYPYNGATTTLETLWMGVPLVTRVGEQFAARNSYTMLKNVGVEEGIAWTDEEYVEWGIRLGTDEVLRQQVHWKLKASRHTSPLWNAKQFTREMEQAYEQMWAIYNQQHS